MYLKAQWLEPKEEMLTEQEDRMKLLNKLLISRKQSTRLDNLKLSLKLLELNEKMEILNKYYLRIQNSFQI